jgi:hypothetical protein
MAKSRTLNLRLAVKVPPELSDARALMLIHTMLCIGENDAHETADRADCDPAGRKDARDAVSLRIGKPKIIKG